MRPTEPDRHIQIDIEEDMDIYRHTTAKETDKGTKRNKVSETQGLS